ncbi:MAG: hypothetical protein WC443_13100 [Desulfobaccales bacterium]
MSEAYIIEPPKPKVAPRLNPRLERFRRGEAEIDKMHAEGIFPQGTFCLIFERPLFQALAEDQPG